MAKRNYDTNIAKGERRKMKFASVFYSEPHPIFVVYRKCGERKYGCWL